MTSRTFHRRQPFPMVTLRLTGCVAAVAVTCGWHTDSGLRAADVEVVVFNRDANVRVMEQNGERVVHHARKGESLFFVRSLESKPTAWYRVLVFKKGNNFEAGWIEKSMVTRRQSQTTDAQAKYIDTVLAQQLYEDANSERNGGNLETALPLYEQVAAIGRKLRNDELMAAAYYQAGTGQYQQRDWDGAIRSLSTAADVIQKNAVLLGKEPYSSWSQDCQAKQEIAAGHVAWGKGQLPNALRHFQKAWQMKPGFPKQLNNFGLIEAGFLAGCIHHELHDLKQAEEAYRQTLQAVGANPAPFYCALKCRALSHWALAQIEAGNLPGARKNLDAADQTCAGICDTATPGTDPAFEAYRHLQKTRVRYLEATGQFDKAIQCVQKLLNDQRCTDRDRAGLHNDQGYLHELQDKLSDAISAYDASLNCYRTALGQQQFDRSVEVAQVHNNRGLAHARNGNVRVALADFEVALKIRQNVLGAAHPRTAQTWKNRGELHLQAGKLNSAGRDLLAARNVIGRFPDRHPVRAELSAIFARLRQAQQQIPAAVAEMRASRQSTHRFATEFLATLPAARQFEFLQNRDRDLFDQVLSMGLRHPQNAALVELAAEALLNRKAIAAEMSALRQRLTRNAGNPRVKRLQDVREKLAGLVIPGITEPRLAEMRRLEQEEEKLLNQLGNAIPVPEWVTLDAVRRQIPKQAVLINVARLRPENFAAGPGQPRFDVPHYAAWVIPAANGGPVSVVDLGPAADIDRGIEATLAEIHTQEQMTAARWQAADYAKLEQVIAQQSRQVARLILSPILKQVGLTQRLLVSPDASLWLLPWEILPQPGQPNRKPRYLIEDFTISYLHSGRELIPRVQGGNRKPGPPVIVAGPAFGVLAAAAPPANRAGLRAGIFPVGFRGFAPLQFGVAEGKAVAAALGNLQPVIRVGNDATENFVSGLKSPRILYLSTHAFATRIDAVDPLAASGLALEGANNGLRGNQQAGDGILTGLEVLGMDLEGTELTVLSACETNAGLVRQGEGVAGLRQAFHIAGSQHVLGTAWSVDDRATALLMRDFMQNFAGNLPNAGNPVQALRSAQLRKIAADRNLHGAALPFFWGAFTVSGAVK